jgi:hypothetical protein
VVFRRQFWAVVGHLSPDAAAGGMIALVRDGDQVTVRSITLDIDADELRVRRERQLAEHGAVIARDRERPVSVALRPTRPWRPRRPPARSVTSICCEADRAGLQVAGFRREDLNARLATGPERFGCPLVR